MEKKNTITSPRFANNHRRCGRRGEIQTSRKIETTHRCGKQIATIDALLFCSKLVFGSPPSERAWVAPRRRNPAGFLFARFSISFWRAPVNLIDIRSGANNNNNSFANPNRCCSVKKRGGRVRGRLPETLKAVSQSVGSLTQKSAA